MRAVCHVCVCVLCVAAKAQIVVGLRDQVVPYRTTLTLSCEVVGVPLPFRSWLKNGHPVCWHNRSHLRYYSLAYYLQLHIARYIFTRDSIYAIARICHANSVRPSVTRVYCIKTAERIIKILSLSDQSINQSITKALVAEELLQG